MEKLLKELLVEQKKLNKTLQTIASSLECQKSLINTKVSKKDLDDCMHDISNKLG